jgi:hypothetical protein
VRISIVPRKYECPGFLSGVISQQTYEKWLHRKAQAHYRRDKKRGNSTSTCAEYKMAIHQAVIDSQGRDAYTHEPLDWHLLSTYDNTQAKEGGRDYKRQFASLPSVDHVGDGTGPANFKICSWKTNDSKSDMTMEEYVSLCKKIVEFNG